MQKTYTPDFMTGKQEANNGEIAMYLVENAHEAVIEKEIFDAVRKLKKKN